MSTFDSLSDVAVITARPGFNPDNLILQTLEDLDSSETVSISVSEEVKVTFKFEALEGLIVSSAPNFELEMTSPGSISNGSDSGVVNEIELTGMGVVTVTET